MRAADLLVPTPGGLYCPPARVHIDPVRAVDRALITHGHSDHARTGHGAVLATPETLAIMAARYGEGFTSERQAIGYGETVHVGEVDFTFFPAGHVLGSAQIRATWQGLSIVVSGDYKRQADPTCVPYEPVRCHVFISEATFGLPVFRHPPAEGEITKLLASLALFPERTHLLGAYSLGKAQRLIAVLRRAGYDAPVYLHGAMTRLCALYQALGVDLGDLRPAASQPKAALTGAVVLCPPSAMSDLWSRRMADPVTAYASGWMRIRTRAKQRGVELPLVISDHVDWDDLIETIPLTGCEELWITHGEEGALLRWAGIVGLPARPLHLVGYGDEEQESAEAAP